MKKDRETASKYRQQALEGDLMAMNNMGVCYAVLWRIMPTDLVTDGHRVAHIKEGHPLLSKVTAMGCTATGIIGAFLAVSSDAFCASLHAMKVMGIAGEKAAAISRENGSMMINFLDELCNLSGHE